MIQIKCDFQYCSNSSTHAAPSWEGWVEFVTTIRKQSPGNGMESGQILITVRRLSASSNVSDLARHACPEHVDSLLGDFLRDVKLGSVIDVVDGHIPEVPLAGAAPKIDDDNDGDSIF